MKVGKTKYPWIGGNETNLNLNNNTKIKFLNIIDYLVYKLIDEGGDSQ